MSPKTVVRHAVSDRPCPRLTPSAISIPRSSQGTGELSYKQPAHKQWSGPWVETDISTTKENRRGDDTERLHLSFLLGKPTEDSSRCRHLLTKIFTSLKELHIFVLLLFSSELHPRPQWPHAHRTAVHHLNYCWCGWGIGHSEQTKDN